MSLTSNYILHSLRDSFVREVIYQEAVESTNDLATSLANEGAPEGTVVIADYQRSGRGRQGNHWHSPRGSLYMSIVLKPQRNEDLQIITLLAGIASVNAIRSLCDDEVSLKWPNDIICNNRKAGGILTESKIESGTVRHLIVGIGINLNNSLNNCPPTLDAKAVAITISALNSDTSNPRDLLAAAILRSFHKGYIEFLMGRDDTIINEWQLLTSTIGRRVKVLTESGELCGIANGMDHSGRLLILTDEGALKSLSSGSLIYI